MSEANELVKIYQKNILYFQKFYPDIYLKLSKHIENQRYELMVDDGGYFNIEIKANESKVYAEDSNLLAQQNVDNCLKDSTNTKKAIFIGTLLGLEIEKLILKTDVPCVMIIEPDLELFKLSCFLIDYEVLTQSRVAIFSIQDSDEILENKVLEFLFTMFYHNNDIVFLKTVNEYQPILTKIDATYKENIFYTLDTNSIKIPKKKKSINIDLYLSNAQKENSRNNSKKAIENYLHVIVCEQYNKLDKNPDVKSKILAAYLNLGNIFYKERLIAESYHCYGKCVYSLVEDTMVYETALHNYVHINQTNKKAFNKMASLLERYIDKDCVNTSLINKLAELLYVTNQHEKAEIFLKPFREILIKDKKIVAMLPTLPVIYDSQEDIDAAREKFENALDSLLTQDIKINEQDLEIYSTFFFAYHNRNNKTLFSKLSRFYEKATPSILYEANHCKNYKYNGKKIKLGFISNFLVEGHPVLKMMQRFIDAFIKDKNYEIFIFSFTKQTQNVFPNNTFVLENSLKENRKQISKHKLDIIVYPEIGMNPNTYILAHARLAPIQCVRSGHPVTTGIASVDYFISHKSIEAKNAQDFFSEKLVLLRSSKSKYVKPNVPKEFIAKKSLGLLSSAHNYLIPSKLQKIHPDFDKLLFRLLEKDKKAKFIFFQDNLENEWDEYIKQRLLKCIPGKHLTFLPFAAKDEFYSLMHHSDAILDPLVFGYGTTAMEAFSIGAPIITLPGQFSCGRSVGSHYKLMDFEELVAIDEDDYIVKAIKLASDKAYQSFCTNTILELNSNLYSDENPIAEYDEFFRSVLIERKH